MSTHKVLVVLHFLLFFIVNCLFISAESISPAPSINCTTENQTSDWIVNCITVIARNRRYETARLELKKVPNYHLLVDKIVRKLYNGNVTRTQACLFMIVKLSWTAYELGLSALVEEMDAHDHLNRLEVLIVEYYVEFIGVRGSKKVQQIRSKVQPHVNNVIVELARNIRDITIGYIYAFGEYSTENMQHYSLVKHMSKLVKRSMDGNLKNFVATFIFVQAGGYFDDWCMSVPAIVQELEVLSGERSEEMMLVAQWFSKKMEKNAAKISSDSWRIHFDQAKVAFPMDMQNLFWNKNCTVKNLFWNEELYADVKLNSAFTLKSDDIPSKNQWIVEHTMKNQVVYFQFKYQNLQNHTIQPLYLCQPSNTTNVSLCDGLSPENWHEWKLTPVVSPNYKPAFVIWQTHSGGYLHATEQLRTKPNQRTIEGSHLDKSSYWKFTCF